MSNSTLKYIGKRLVISLITLFVILMVLFLMVKFLPGSPINNEKLSASARAAIEAQYGLDKPIPVQFVRYIQNMLTGDFGVSFNLYKDMQVSSLVGSAAKLSMIYGLCAVIIGTVIGMFLGVFAALHKNTIWDTIATVISVIGVSIPSFVFAMLILLLFASKLRLLPTSYSSSNAIKSSIMPILALSVGVIANVARFTRTEMVSVLTSEYMTLAKAPKEAIHVFINDMPEGTYYPHGEMKKMLLVTRISMMQARLYRFRRFRQQLQVLKLEIR